MYIDNNLSILNDIVVIISTGHKELTGLLITAGKNDEHVFMMEERLTGNRLVFLQLQSHMFQFQHLTVQLISCVKLSSKKGTKKHIGTIRKGTILSGLCFHILLVYRLFPHDE